MYRSAFKKSIALLLVVFTPVLFAQNPGAAVLTGSGAVSLNGAQLSNSNAVVAGDVIQTQENGTATVNGPGGTILIEPNSIVRFQGQTIALDRGQVSIATGKGFSVNARDLRITPVSNDWTQFYVTRTGGSINVIARKNDVTVVCGAAGSERVKEGKQISRDDADNCGLVAKASGTPTAARGPFLTSSAAKWTALAAGGGLTIWALAQGDDPVSPAIP